MKTASVRGTHLKVEDAQVRLSHFYGDVAKQQNRDIINLIAGRKILDVGCGYGYLIKQISDEKAGVQITGIDINAESIDMGHKLYGIEIKNMSVYKLDFPAGLFDTVILREAIHHFDTYDRLMTALNEINRVCSRELIIFDPNPNWIVKLARVIIGHVDPEAPSGYVIDALNKIGFTVKSVQWRDVIAFPLSGGFVGKEFIPNIKFLKNLTMMLDTVLNKILFFARIQKYFCWRYIIYAVKKGRSDQGYEQ